MNRVRSHKQILVFILLYLYSLGITSFTSIHLIHDLFHLLHTSQHTHDHGHHHSKHPLDHDHSHVYEDDKHDYEKSMSGLKNHGHKHNKFIDVMLQAIEKEPQRPESHVIYVLELFDHLNFYAQNFMKDLDFRKNKPYVDIKFISTLCYLSPPTPPPKA